MRIASYVLVTVVVAVIAYLLFAVINPDKF